MFGYTPEAWFDWFRSMMEEMSPGTVADTKKNKAKACGKRRPTRASRSRRLRSWKHADDVPENLVGGHRGKFPCQAHSPGDAIPLGQQLQQRGRFVGQSKILA